jgi:hypothetical protein
LNANSVTSKSKYLLGNYRYIFVAIISIFLIWISATFLPDGVDLAKTFRPAALNVLSGRSPYEYIFNPPWVLIPFIPLSIIPVPLGRGIWFLVSIIMFAYTAYRLKANPIALLFFLLSPPVMKSLMDGNVDFMPLVGFVLPPQIGLFFVMIKPQIGIGVGIYWLIREWQSGGIKRVIKIFWPVTSALALSLLIFGYWPNRWGEMMVNAQSLNHSFWPSTIPVGLALIVASIRKKDIRYAMGAGPCLSPYSLLYSWSGAFLALSRSQYEMIAAVVGLWIVVLIRAFQ